MSQLGLFSDLTSDCVRIDRIDVVIWLLTIVTQGLGGQLLYTPQRPATVAPLVTNFLPSGL